MARSVPSDPGTTTLVARIPECDVCKYDLHKPGVPAVADVKTRRGPWANVCEPHLKSDGPAQLGVGRGQRFILAE